MYMKAFKCNFRLIYVWFELFSTLFGGSFLKKEESCEIQLNECVTAGGWQFIISLWIPTMNRQANNVESFINLLLHCQQSPLV